MTPSLLPPPGVSDNTEGSTSSERPSPLSTLAHLGVLWRVRVPSRW